MCELGVMVVSVGEEEKEKMCVCVCACVCVCVRAGWYLSGMSFSLVARGK